MQDINADTGHMGDQYHSQMAAKGYTHQKKKFEKKKNRKCKKKKIKIKESQEYLCDKTRLE